MLKNYYIYIITNKYNKVLYTGVTNNLSRRIYEHKSKKIEGFTKRYNLNKLVYFENTDDISYALLREKQIKGWLRSKKLKMIEGMNPNWEDLTETYNLLPDDLSDIFV